jgi:hypothetical protein
MNRPAIVFEPPASLAARKLCQEAYAEARRIIEEAGGSRSGWSGSCNPEWGSKADRGEVRHEDHGDHGDRARSHRMRCPRGAGHPDIGGAASAQGGGLHEHRDRDVLLKAREQRARCSILLKISDFGVVACRLLSFVVVSVCDRSPRPRWRSCVSPRRRVRQVAACAAGRVDRCGRLSIVQRCRSPFACVADYGTSDVSCADACLVCGDTRPLPI